MGYINNIKKLYLINFLHSLILAYVIERLFWQERGMTVQMVVYCEIIYGAVVVLLEIPSGVMADKFGRKQMLVLNGLLASIELIILLFARSFWMFGLAVFLSGVGKAFSSGSENALLYDSLLYENRESSFEKILGRISAVDFAGTAIAALSGSIAASYFGFEFNYIVSLCSTVAAFMLILTLKEPPMVTKPESELNGIKGYSREALSLFKHKPVVLIYSLTGATLGACLIYLDEFWQLVLDGVGIPVALFGIVSVVTFSFRIPGNLLAYKLKERFNYNRVLTVIVAVNAAGYAAVFLTRNLFCLIPMIAVSLGAGITEPLIAGYLHHHTESHIRATVESFSSLGLRLLSVLIGLAFGYVSSKYSIFSGFAVLCIICTVYLLFFVLKPKNLQNGD